MAKVPKYIGKGEGGAGVAQLPAIFYDLIDDLNELRNKQIALLQKLDADAGTADTDYAATLTPAPLKTVKE